MRCLFLLTGIFLSLFTGSVSAVKITNCKISEPIIFGILPFVSAQQLVNRFSPLTNYLSLHLKTELRIETAPNFAEFTRRTTEDKRYDILFTAPHFYSQANKAGYKLMVSVNSPGMRAVIVAPRQSTVKSISDLPGKRLAMPQIESLASLLVRKHLIKNGINPDKDLEIIFTPTHDASLLSSYHGITDASALMQPPYSAASQQVRDSMQIIAKTEQAPHIPISAGHRMSEACIADITSLLLSMSSTSEGKKVLKHNHFSGFRQPHSSEYEKINTLMQQR